MSHETTSVQTLSQPVGETETLSKPVVETVPPRKVSVSVPLEEIYFLISAHHFDLIILAVLAWMGIARGNCPSLSLSPFWRCAAAGLSPCVI